MNLVWFGSQVRKSVLQMERTCEPPHQRRDKRSSRMGVPARICPPRDKSHLTKLAPAVQNTLYRRWRVLLQTNSGLRDAERGKHMAVDGNWNITLSTPLGDRDATLTLKSDGGALTGKQAADGNEADIVDGTVNGNDVAWKASITNPMPLTLAFTGKVDGDAISGDVSIGPMGSFPFKGTRA